MSNLLTLSLFLIDVEEQREYIVTYLKQNKKNNKSVSVIKRFEGFYYPPFARFILPDNRNLNETYGRQR